MYAPKMHKSAPEAVPSVRKSPPRKSPGSVRQLSGRWPAGAGYGAGPTSVIQLQPSQSTSTPWTTVAIKLIRAQLARLGLYDGTPEQGVGAATATALTEAYGDDSWMKLTSATVLAQLRKAKPVAGGKKGQHRFRWGEMVKDFLLDMVLGLGFDEGGNQKKGKENLEGALADHKFQKDPGAKVTSQLYKKAGRPGAPPSPGDYFVRMNALGYTPPVNPSGKKRWIHAIVRFIYSLAGKQDGKAAAGFKQGMATSDIVYYSGHGRYGSGPDFDRDFTRFDLLDDKGKTIGSFTDYDLLKAELGSEGAPYNRDAWQQFEWRAERGLIRVTAPNTGNVVLSSTNRQAWKFGSKLMFWNLGRKKGGSAAATGPKGTLADPQGSQSRRYRVMVFDGCTTKDYVKSIHATPGYGPRQADVLASTTSLDWGVEGATLGAFLNGILNQLSAEEIVTAVDKVQKKKPGAYEGYGLEDNPQIK